MNKEQPFKSRKPSPELSPVQEEVLHYLTVDFLTPKQIAIRRKTSPQAVNEIIRRLKKIGALSKPFQDLSKNRPSQKGQGVRLHAQEFNIKLLWNDDKYGRLRKKAPTMIVDGNTVRLYNKSIEVYSGQSFYGDSVHLVTANSLSYWRSFLGRLENDLKVLLLKPRAMNIRLVNSHYAEVRNELAKECNIKAESIRIYSEDDGKLWFTIDNSFNLDEAETLHPQTAKEDMADVVRPFFNDLRKHRATISDIVMLLKKQQELNCDVAEGLKAVLDMQRPKEVSNGISERPNYWG